MRIFKARSICRLDYDVLNLRSSKTDTECVFLFECRCGKEVPASGLPSHYPMDVQNVFIKESTMPPFVEVNLYIQRWTGWMEHKATARLTSITDVTIWRLV